MKAKAGRITIVIHNGEKLAVPKDSLAGDNLFTYIKVAIKKDRFCQSILWNDRVIKYDPKTGNTRF